MHVADMYESYGTYAADDEYFDNHYYDDDTGDDKEAGPSSPSPYHHQ